MSLEFILFALRIIIAVLLYTFLGVMLWIMWRDLKAADQGEASRQRVQGKLVVSESEMQQVSAGHTYPLYAITSLGRAPTNHIVFNDSATSSEHALLVRRGSQWWLEDQHSRNGTTLNGHTVQEPAVVTSGDVIGVGRVKLRLELD